MTDLSADDLSFLEFMKRSHELEAKGFEMLASGKTAEPERFFDALCERGFFARDRLPEPEPVGEDGLVRIPYWSALGYLLAVADRAVETKAEDLINKVLELVRTLSSPDETREAPPDNYHTHRIFAEIIGKFPASLLKREDIDLIARWLDGSFDRSLVAQALSTGVLPNLLESSTDEALSNALEILALITKLEAPPEGGTDLSKPVFMVDGYWLQRLLPVHIERGVLALGQPLVALLLERAHQVVSLGDRQLPSWLERPAIEDHPQNRSWEHGANAIIDAARDGLVLHCRAIAREEARDMLRELIESESDILRRLAIHAQTECAGTLGLLDATLVGELLNDRDVLHELYRYLFVTFRLADAHAQEGVINAIEGIGRQDANDTDLETLRIKRKWYNALRTHGNEAVELRLTELESIEGIGGLSEHPDLHVYMESGWVSDRSPLTKGEVMELLRKGDLVDRLNGFEPAGDWRSPNRRGLVDALIAAIEVDPEPFLATLPIFQSAAGAYQYGVVEGIRRAWKALAAEPKKDVEWRSEAWSEIFEFAQYLIDCDRTWDAFGADGDGWTPDGGWIPAVVADLVADGCRDDALSFPEELIPQATAVLEALLERLPVVSNEDSKDALQRAINTPRGRAIQALIILCLRTCRVSDIKGGNHDDAWAIFRPIFERELDHTRTGNEDFLALVGDFLPNLCYISEAWVQDSAAQLFPSDRPHALLAFADGLGYSNATRKGYQILRESDVPLTLLKTPGFSGHARERLIQRIGLAYLWGDHELADPVFIELRDNDRNEGLAQLSRFFWSVSGQELEDEHRNRVLAYWKWVDAIEPRDTEDLAALKAETALLVHYLDSIDEDALGLLRRTAPHASENHNADHFIEGLGALAENHPAEVAEILGVLLDNWEPQWDLGDQLKGLVQWLGQNGCREEAVALCDRLRRLPGFAELYRDLTD